MTRSPNEGTNRVSQLRSFDHVGITVADLDTVAASFVGLGLEVEGRMFVEGEFLDTLCGIRDSRTEIVFLRPPGGGTGLELSRRCRRVETPLIHSVSHARGQQPLLNILLAVGAMAR